MATRNINNYINELLNEATQAERDRMQTELDRSRFDDNEPKDKERRRKEYFDRYGITGKEDKELMALKLQAGSRNASRGRTNARLALKAMENQAAPAKTTGGMGKEMDKMRDGFLSNLDNFSSGKGITDNLQASGSGKKPKKDTPGREIEKIPVERRPMRPEPQRYPENPQRYPRRPDDGRPNMEPKPAYIYNRRPDDGRPNMEPKPAYHDRRPDDGRPVSEKKPFYHDRRPDDGLRPVAEPKPAYIPDRRPADPRYDDIRKPIGKPIESFPSARKLVKNKRLARAAQADKTGDAYMAQVMGQGKATAQSEYQKRIDAAMDREKDRIKTQKQAGTRNESGIRDTFKRYDPNRKYEPPRTADYRPDRDDPIGGYGPAIPRTDLLNRGGGSNIMPVNKPAIAGQKPRSLSGEIQSDFINPQKRTRMGGY